MVKDNLLSKKTTMITLLQIVYAIAISITIFIIDEGTYEQNWNNIGNETKVITALIVANYSGQMILYYLFRNHGLALRSFCAALFSIFIGMPLYLILLAILMSI